MYLVRSGAAEGFERLVQAQGANPMELLAELGLSQPQFRNPNTYIAYPKLAELMEACSERCASPLFGLQLAQRQTSHALGDLSVIVSTAKTVGEALQQANQHLYLHAAGIHLDVETRGDQVRLGLVLDFTSPRGTEQLAQLSVGHLVTFFADLMACDRFAIPLHLRQVAPAGVSNTTVFKQVRFDQPFDGIQVPRQWLEGPNHQDEAALHRHFKDFLEQLQRRYPDNLENQIKELIARLLPSGECSVERVAAALGMHPRTLQTHLQQRNTSYREILQATRQDLAEQHLRHSSINITELALQLGYSDVAVFSRHFKQWLGHSPRNWAKLKRRKEVPEDQAGSPLHARKLSSPAPAPGKNAR